ncbi:MAG: cyclopropane-fatty-acyl-phospholipid synthase family protein [Acetobacter fabarum]|jgi:cyclopropane-fatty-acyl-phospholipid synthase|uniref:SAM-dependent methyltransferase n=1 Tax=Acetobacter fabarum TaxID=483199 RepID=UPI00242CCE14|nr:cyclopropane-fatty-acyl-phospholipid synthase family protein [Acetobacter fabarum]MCH4026895.1 cyclopropane-fatty-acyl-phospholipid synthase family protein [Acetobacter fabarum]MCH4054973.1 cyclopropane-fatty-acyl-phospholipid synthase family protein [Acetobacter fabarum]MCH4085244.1 cyclopropane-fatty-acyl-phospholipid synthase family protein [Acetobacter fabarum]MCH4127211.1 cyclopropane-fatty-acyl-phospholipid synthase family protein [Acetobacter fabarum]MCH4137513.1 cyclopropane-fatty-a
MKRVLGPILRHFVESGSLRVLWPDATTTVYHGAKPGPQVGVHLKNAAAVKSLVLNPGLAFGEAYMDGFLEPLDCTLYDLLHLLMLNAMNPSGHIAEQLSAALRYVRRGWIQFNSTSRSKQNVAHHYDLGNSLYELFLDKDWQYSCAYFPTGEETLDEAQEAKKHHIAAKLKLDRPGLEVLDIGCGWGGMALTLAKDYGARVTGITLSEEQLAFARQRAQDAGLAGQVSFELLDYRHLKRKFDRIVSVGMFEHVGVGHYKAFFETIRNALTPDGIALIHSIGRSDEPGTTNPWMNKYIFPGGYSPALSEVFSAVQQTGLWVTDCEILRLHYARTIAIWRERFAARRPEAVAMYDERFARMFEFYLAAAELAFRVQGHMNFQLQLSPSISAVPYTRDYMVDAERTKTGAN